jgi:hypothetical protein
MENEMKTLAEKIEVMQAALEGKEIEFLALDLNGDGWSDVPGEPYFNWYDFDYRIKEVSKTKPQINWDHVNPDFKWMATDEDNQTYLYTAYPYLEENWWDFLGGQCVGADYFASFVPGTCNWEDSLVERPETE